jgi:hypothetical protein
VLEERDSPMNDKAKHAELVEDFEELNTQFFGGLLKPPIFSVSPPPFGTYAATTPSSIKREDGTRMRVNQVMFIHPSTVRQGRRYVRDTLLHEMVHIALDAEDGDGDKEHGSRFASRANDLGRLLALPPVLSLSDGAIEWPQSVRPSSYHGAWK